MKASEISLFVKNNIQPLHYPTSGPLYRCAAYLVDGLYLPCVVVAEANSCVKLAMRRFEEARKSSDNDSHSINHYLMLVKSFVCAGNRINDYDIDHLELSRYAIAPERLLEIHGETSMGWTAFSAEMDDGCQFFFGTNFLFEFFNIPEGYTANRISKITHKIRPEAEPIYRERPFFTCYCDGL